jgi:hypothetical protein
MDLSGKGLGSIPAALKNILRAFDEYLFFLPTAATCW